MLRNLVLTLLAAALLLPAGGCRRPVQADLVLISPHSKAIRDEYERAFKAYYQAKHGKAVKIEWRDVGGSTSTTQFLINSAGGSGVDIYFGGGAPDHRLLASKDMLQELTLPAELLAALPETIGGVRQRDEKNRWFGAALSQFGIFYNAKLLEQQKLPIPASWEDLAAPAMFGKLAAADGKQSGSARASYEMVIQSADSWPEGFSRLLRFWANCKSFPESASRVTADVANGEVLAGPAIDFYAFDTIATRGQHLGFAAVKGAAFTPDPISLLKGAPHPELAKEFIEFVLSFDGQALLCLPPGSEGGPAGQGLYRQPIRKDVYDKLGDKMLKPLVNPFERSGKFDEEIWNTRQGLLLAPLMQAAALDNKQALNEAWKAVIDAGCPEKLVKMLTALPENLADQAAAHATAKLLADPRQREELTRQWTTFFRAQYEKVKAEAEKK